MASKVKVQERALTQEPLVTFGSLGRVLDVGPAAAKSAAQRLGIEPTRLGNGREFLTFEQAQDVARCINSRNG